MKCDKSCNECSDHKKKCNECAEDYFKIYEQQYYCYLEEELYYSFEQKYFKDNDVYKPCDGNCFTCWGSATNCTKCKEGFNLVINEQDFSKTCKQQSEFINNKYFLLNGEEYYHLCDENCKSCQFSKTNCTLCNDGYYLIEDINKCVNTDDVIGYYLYDNRLFKKCNYTCKACDSIDKCTECAPPYYLLVLAEGKAKCITQQEKKEQYNNYYLKQETSSVDGTSTFKFKRCAEQCRTCEDGNNDGSNCIECNEGYVFFEDGDKECKDKTIRTIK
jgi:hypothetical protein